MDGCRGVVVDLCGAGQCGGALGGVDLKRKGRKG